MTSHPSAVISAQLHESVVVGPYSIVGEESKIGEGTVISSHVRIENQVTIGAECKIFHGAVIGSVPQDLKFQGEHSEVQIGDHTVIREYATINRGTGGNKTIVGNNCLVMTYVHIAHDCVIGDNVILSNAINMAGHVEIGDFAVIGGMVPIHQFVRIGSYAMVGGGYRVNQDVPPFVLAAGEPLKYCGLNYIGLRRNGFQEARIKEIEKAYFLIYQSKKNRREALAEIKNLPENPDLKILLDFFEHSERGVIGA